MRKALCALVTLLVYPSLTQGQPIQPADDAVPNEEQNRTPAPELTPPQATPEALAPAPEPSPPPAESETERAALPSTGGSRFLPQGRWFDRLDDGDPLFAIDNDPFTVALRGLLQIQLAPFVQEDARRSNGDAADAAGFALRRARLGVDGRFVGGVTYALLYEFWDGSQQEGGARLLDATIGYTRFPLAQMTFGAQKVPFSKVALTSAANLQLIERPFSARQLPDVLPIVPDRQLGAVVSGELLGAAGYAVGVFNGNDTLFRGDDNGGFLYAARLELHPLGDTGARQAALGPEQEGHDRIRLALGGDAYWDDGATGTQLAFSVDLTAKWRGLSLTAEWLQSSFEPARDPVREPELAGVVDQRAFFVQAGYFVLPGRLELSARGELWDMNTDDDRDANVQALTGGLNLYLLGDRIKAQLQYTHRREPADRQARNDTGVLQLQAKF